MFGRAKTPAQQDAHAELKAAKRALAADPVNTGAAGRSIDIDSPAGRANIKAQDRVTAAEQKLKG